MLLIASERFWVLLQGAADKPLPPGAGYVANGGRQDPTSPWLWAVSQYKSLDAWVCKVTASLLGSSGDQPLIAMRILAGRQPGLARVLLLPALLECLQADGLHDTLPRPLAAAISSVFAGALATAPPPSAHQLAAVGVIVGALITLRARTMHARHATKNSNTSKALHSWTHSFWEHIDFVQAAAAAKAAGSPISALMLLEMAAEVDCELVPTRLLASPRLCRQYAEVSAELPAPDCARNVPSGGSLPPGSSLVGGGDGAGTLRVLVLRGDHLGVLSLLDAAQQQARLDDFSAANDAAAAANAAAAAAAAAGVRQPQSQAHADSAATATSAVGGASLPPLILRSARALRSIGCHALCAASLRAAALGGGGGGGAHGAAGAVPAGWDSARGDDGAGGAMGGGTVEAELRELRAECAWRLGAWESTTAASSDADVDWSTSAVAGGGVLGDGSGMDGGGGFHERLRLALHSMQVGHAAAASAQLHACMLEQARKLGAAGEEGGKRSLAHVLAVRMASDAKEVAEALHAGGSAAAAATAVRVSHASAAPSAQARHQRQLLAAAGGDFELIEPLLALHATMVRRYAPSAQAPLALLLLHSASTARLCGAPSVAGALLAEAAAVPAASASLSGALGTCTQWEYAQLLWQQGDRHVPDARSIALNVAAALAERAVELACTASVAGGGPDGGGGNASLHERMALAQACRRAAEWGVVEGRHGASHAAELYERALATCGEGAGVSEERCHAHAAYASWLDTEHRQAAQRHAESPDELRAAQLYELAKDELRAAQEQADAAERAAAAPAAAAPTAAAQPPSRRASRGSTPTAASPSATTPAEVASAAALTRRIALLRSHVQGYEQAVARRRDAQLGLAVAALRQHAACARCGDEHDHAALFGLVGLWLEYQGAMPEAQAELPSLPTHKLLPLIHQLACQLGPTSPPPAAAAADSAAAADGAAAEAEAEGRRAFQTALRELLLRVAKAHLHVVLPHLLALAHADRFAQSEQLPTRTAVDRGREDAAKQLVQQLRAHEETSAASAAAAAAPSAGKKGGVASRQTVGSAGGGSVVQATQLLWDFYLQLAWVPVKSVGEQWQAHVDSKDKNKSAFPKLLPLVETSKARVTTERFPLTYAMKKGADLYQLVQQGHASLAAIPTAVPTNPGAGGGSIVRFAHFGPANPLLVAQAKAKAAAAAASGAAAMPGEKREREQRSSAAAAEPEWGSAGGVNMPRIVYCYSEDGQCHKQLVKGRDDLRGDALMQQAFGVLNVLLARDAATRQRALHMRTYRVVPLSPTAGVLEYVGDTMPLSTYLASPTSSAHDRYRPHDMKHTQARSVMNIAGKQFLDQPRGQRQVDNRQGVYHDVTEKLRPVFHHFFLERYHAPATWFSRRLAYASSVAAGSMIGFVLGLGDRHSSNILIDTRSAELVHIDLGIAFDAGKLQRCPECVPFRLTRDIEDGLGVSGVEGVLRGAAEHTMRVLRANSAALVTILEVFVRNPLYKWSLQVGRDPSAVRIAAAAAAAAAAHPDDPAAADAAAHAAAADALPEENKGNREAERALLRIQDKLGGRVAGHPEALAVEGQVRALLDEARDPENLCKMFDGWAAWL